jgi:hypothetical protein
MTNPLEQAAMANASPNAPHSPTAACPWGTSQVINMLAFLSFGLSCMDLPRSYVLMSLLWLCLAWLPSMKDHPRQAHPATEAEAGRPRPARARGDTYPAVLGIAFIALIAVRPF